MVLTEETLPPGEERELGAEGWRFCVAQEGVLYWMGQPRAMELSPGEMLVAGPGVQGCLRASQINGARLRSFSVNLAALLGVFSLTERDALLRLDARPDDGPELLAADHPAARLVAQAQVAETLAQHALARAELLHVALLALAGRIHRSEEETNGVSTVEKRFQELVLNAPDGDLLSRSPEDIAALCGCSVRHLRRLFRSAFQFNLRVAQEEARLRKARELVEQTGIRIADVARTVGYRHVGQFNASFKRLFGRTPSECRANGSSLVNGFSRLAVSSTARRVQQVLLLLCWIASGLDSSAGDFDPAVFLL